MPFAPTRLEVRLPATLPEASPCLTRKLTIVPLSSSRRALRQAVRRPRRSQGSMWPSRLQRRSHPGVPPRTRPNKPALSRAHTSLDRQGEAMSPAVDERISPQVRDSANDKAWTGPACPPNGRRSRPGRKVSWHCRHNWSRNATVIHAPWHASRRRAAPSYRNRPSRSTRSFEDVRLIRAAIAWAPETSALWSRQTVHGCMLETRERCAQLTPNSLRNGVEDPDRGRRPADLSGSWAESGNLSDGSDGVCAVWSCADWPCT